MALSATGIGSNLDINGIISQLMAVESQPLTVLAQREASYQAKLSAYGSLKGALSTFQSAVQALKDANKFSTLKATSTDAAVIAATASGDAIPGTYTVNVSSLAQAQIQAAGTKYANISSALGLSGDIAFTVAGKSFSVTLAATDNLQDIATKINDAADNVGVTASIVNDGSDPGNLLVISANKSGIANAVTIDDSGLSTSFAFSEKQPAQDLALTVNGIPVSKSSNAVDDAIQGVTLTIAATGSATISVAKDSSGGKAAINAFVKAYNDLNKSLSDLSAYNAETKQAAVLQGESSVRTIQSQVRAALSDLVRGDGAYHTLSQLGISFSLDGSLSVDAAKLDDALAASATDVADFFAGDGTAGKPVGLAVRLDNLVSNFLGSTGILTAVTDGINRSIKDIGTRRDALNLRLADVEARYRRQFTALDTLISSLTQTSNYLQQQLANLPKIGSN